MSPEETRELLAFADEHNCFGGCKGCIGESKDGCVHPDHPLMQESAKQIEEVASHG